MLKTITRVFEKWLPITLYNTQSKALGQQNLIHMPPISTIHLNNFPPYSEGIPDDARIVGFSYPFRYPTSTKTVTATANVTRESLVTWREEDYPLWIWPTSQLHFVFEDEQEAIKTLNRFLAQGRTLNLRKEDESLGEAIVLVHDVGLYLQNDYVPWLPLTQKTYFLYQGRLKIQFALKKVSRPDQSGLDWIQQIIHQKVSTKIESEQKLNELPPVYQI